MTDEQADAMPVPISPDAEPPLTDHETNESVAYIYGRRSGLRGDPLRSPYFAKSDEGYAYNAGFIDGKLQRERK